MNLTDLNITVACTSIVDLADVSCNSQNTSTRPRKRCYKSSSEKERSGRLPIRNELARVQISSRIVSQISNCLAIKPSGSHICVNIF